MSLGYCDYCGGSTDTGGACSSPNCPTKRRKEYYPFLEPMGSPKPLCRFCGGPCKALNNNSVIGPGYAEWNYACRHCGKVQ